MPLGMFDPRQVTLGDPSKVAAGGKPYLPTTPVTMPAAPKPTPRPVAGAGDTSSTVAPAVGTVGAQAVRATEGGPFDQAYRQNLATFAGGQMARPGGSLTFDPTASQGGPGSLFGDLGGQGPEDLLSQALGGGAASFMAPPAPAPAPAQNKPKPKPNPLQWWGNQHAQNGRMMNP